MVSKRKDEELRRRPPTRSPRTRILVVCEGEITEPAYFKAFQRHARNPLLHVEPYGPAGVPLSVVTKAIEMRNDAARRARDERDESLKWDEVWVVHDRDDHPNVARAHALARKEKTEVALSNPSFELWALLHFEDHRREVHRDKVRAALKKHLPRYKKELEFEAVHRGYAEAVERARALDLAAQRDGAAARNPTTGVYRLTERIRRRD